MNNQAIHQLKCEADNGMHSTPFKARSIHRVLRERLSIRTGDHGDFRTSTPTRAARSTDAFTRTRALEHILMIRKRGYENDETPYPPLHP
jgi:hypothetical protein